MCFLIRLICVDRALLLGQKPLAAQMIATHGPLLNAENVRQQYAVGIETILTLGVCFRPDSAQPDMFSFTGL